MRKYLLSILLLVVVFLVGCEKFEKKKKKIILGTEAQYAPFEYVDDSGKIVGFDIDLSKAVLEKAGYEFEIVDMGFSALIPALTTKKIDIIASGMVKNGERAKVINFSDGYYISAGGLAVRYDDDTIKNIKDVKGRVTGAELGTTNVEVLKKAESSEVIEYDGSANLYTALVQGKIDALQANITAINVYIKQHPNEIKIVGDIAEKSDICFGIRKEDEQLLKDVNKALKELKDNGVYEGLVRKWLE